MSRRVERLNEYMQFRGINPNIVTQHASLGQGTLTKCSAEGKDMTVTLAERILAAYPDMSREWLLWGEGDMLVSGNPTSAKVNTPTIEALMEQIRLLNEKVDKLLEYNEEKTQRLLGIVDNLSKHG